MADRIKGITIEIGGDTTKLSKALQGVERELKSAQSSLKDVNNLLKLDPGNVDLLRQKQGLLNDAVKATEEKIRQEREALEQLKNTPGFDATSKDAQALERQIIADEQALKGLKDQVKDFGSVAAQKFEAVGQKIKEVGDKITGIGTSLSMKVTAPLTAVGAGAIASFKEVDAGLDTVITKTGASGDALADMQERVKNLATSIPTDFQTAGDAIGEVNTRFGLTGDELEDLSGKFIKFAQLNNTDVSSSIDNVQAAMAAFNLDVSDAGDVLDILNKAGQDTGVSVDKLAQDLTANAAAFKEMGFGVNSAAGFLANLNKNGVDTSSVMAGLKKALVNAAKDGKTMDQALAELDERMSTASTSTEAMQAAIDLFGAKAGPQLAAAIQEGRLSFEELNNVVRDTTDNVANTFDATLDPIDNWQTAMNQAKLAGAELGGALQETLAPMVERLSEFTGNLTKKFRALSPEQQQLIVMIGLVAAAIGPVLVVIGTLISSIGSIVAAIGPVISAIGTVIGVLGGPLTAAIVAAIAVGALIIKNWDEIKAAISNAIEAIKTGIQNFASAVQEKWKAFWDAVKSIALTMWDGIKSVIEFRINLIKTVITTVMNAIKTVFSTVWNAIKTVVTTVVDAIKTNVGGKIEAIKTTVTTIFENMKTAVSNTFTAMKDFIFGIFDSVVEKVSAVWDFISGIVSKIGGALSSIGDSANQAQSASVQSYASAYNNPVMFTKPTVLPTLNGFKKFGDGNGAEVVLGMSKLKELVQGGGSTNNINVVVNAAPGMDETAVAQKAINMLTLEMRRQGAAFA